MWTPQLRNQETWFLAVDKNVSYYFISQLLIPMYKNINTYKLFLYKLSLFYKGDAIQILGQRKDQGFLQSVLLPSRCYRIEKCGCGIDDRYQKWVNNEIYMAVGITSSITPLPDTVVIPRHWFYIITKKQIPDYKDQHACLNIHTHKNKYPKTKISM